MRFSGISRRRWPLAGLGVAAIAVAAVLAVGGASGARATSTVLARFPAHDAYAWTVPTGVATVTFTVYGASGGSAANGSTLVSVGGAGGEARGQFAVTPGQTFEIVVGGRGGDNSGLSAGAGGFNGGGHGADGHASTLGGGGGGGGSDVRIGGNGNPCATTKSCGYADRIIVGGGGGGGAYDANGNGGAGGGLAGQPAPAGGTQETGGQHQDANCFATADGSFGLGGDADPTSCLFGDGGGGGGWYGGGAGLTSGGGSGFVSHFASRNPFPGLTHRGDGLIVISTP